MYLLPQYTHAHHTVPPSFVDESPVLDRIVNSHSTNITCKVKGYPQPAITWSHNGRDAATDRDKYRIHPTMSDDPPFIIESTLSIMDLSSSDSGNVICVATVTTEEGQSDRNQMMFQLSVLGEH